MDPVLGVLNQPGCCRPPPPGRSRPRCCLYECPIVVYLARHQGSLVRVKSCVRSGALLSVVHLAPLDGMMLDHWRIPALPEEPGETDSEQEPESQ